MGCIFSPPSHGAGGLFYARRSFLSKWQDQAILLSTDRLAEWILDIFLSIIQQTSPLFLRC